MYTRCPSCNSTFRVTANVLQMAEGEVRCGSCGVVFNALQTLVDDWSGADFTLPGAPRLSHPDDPLPAGPVQDTPAGGDPPVPDTLEFNVPENEWQRYFITPPEQPAGAAARAEPELGGDFESTAAEIPGDAVDDIFEDAGPAAEPMAPRSLEEETADTDTWQAFLREAENADEVDDEPLFVVGDDDDGKATEVHVLVRRQAEPAPSRVPMAEAPGEPGPEADAPYDLPDEDDADAGFEVEFEGETDAEADPAVGEFATERGDPEADEAPARRPAAHTVLDWGPPPAFPERGTRPLTHAGRWLAASLVAALALAGQAGHYYRDVLAADPAWGAAVRNVYARLGIPLAPGWPLDAYEIRGAKAIAENSGPGALDIVAEIAVTGSQAVGLPMVRIVLRDRWSNPVGSGVFGASEYLAEAPPRSGVYPPGTLIPVQISLKDPGSAAQGYELDVCVPDRQLGLQCKTARDPFRR